MNSRWNWAMVRLVSSKSRVLPTMLGALSRLKRWLTRAKGTMSIEKTVRRGLARWMFVVFGSEDCGEVQGEASNARWTTGWCRGKEVGVGDSVDQSGHRTLQCSQSGSQPGGLQREFMLGKEDSFIGLDSLLLSSMATRSISVHRRHPPTQVSSTGRVRLE